MTYQGSTLVSLVIIWFSLCVQCPAQTARAPVDRASLDINVVDAYGHPVHPSSIRLTSAAGQDFSQSFRGTEGRNIPYGDYRLRILVSGFQLWDRAIHVFQPRVRLTAGMELGAIEGPKPYCEFSGRVSGLPKETAAWVRLLPVYANEIWETSIEASGSFRFAVVECGAYVVAVIRGLSVAHLTQITLRGNMSPMMISIPEAVDKASK